MDVEIRPAQVGDAAAIAHVHARSWQAAYLGLVPQDYLDGLDLAARREQRRAGWERILADASWPDAATLVATRDGEVVGFANFGPSRDDDARTATVGEVTAIYLLPSVWDTGTGRRLLDRCVEALTRAGYRAATLWVLEKNHRARRFYAAAGWRPDGATKTDEIRGFPLVEIRYRRRLGPRP